ASSDGARRSASFSRISCRPRGRRPVQPRLEGRGPRMNGSIAAGCIAVAVLACAAGCSDGGGDGALGSRSARIRVDDPDFQGALGDGRLSLSEAIELANGALSLADLDPTERGRVDGEP